MKNVLLILAMSFAALGCDLSRFANTAKVENVNSTKPSPSAQPSSSPATTPKPEATPVKTSLPDSLRKMKGKYPVNVKLLEMPELSARLKKLLGGEFAKMKKYWNVESPIEIEDDILMTTGCEAHNCGANRYDLVVDLKNDNINVFHEEDSGTKHFFENGEIKLPKKFADEITR